MSSGKNTQFFERFFSSGEFFRCGERAKDENMAVEGEKVGENGIGNGFSGRIWREKGRLFRFDYADFVLAGIGLMSILVLVCRCFAAN